MASTIFQELLATKIDSFKSIFTNAKDVFYDANKKKIIHPGEFGRYREQIVKDLLSFFLPPTMGISSGFVIDSYDNVSTQCDVIIYDKEETPDIYSSYEQKFIPIETVLLAGEIKSNINDVSKLKEYLSKLSQFKQLRKNVKNPDIKKPGKDQIGTFLICKKLPNKFNYDNSLLYSDSNKANKHNLILSIDDGLYAFADGQGVLLPYPTNHDKYVKSDGSRAHIERFLFNVRIIANLTTRLFLDLAYYYTDNWIHKLK